MKHREKLPELLERYYTCPPNQTLTLLRQIQRTAEKEINKALKSQTFLSWAMTELRNFFAS